MYSCRHLCCLLAVHCWQGATVLDPTAAFGAFCCMRSCRTAGACGCVLSSTAAGAKGWAVRNQVFFCCQSHCAVQQLLVLLLATGSDMCRLLVGGGGGVRGRRGGGGCANSWLLLCGLRLACSTFHSRHAVACSRAVHLCHLTRVLCCVHVHAHNPHICFVVMCGTSVWPCAAVM